MPKDWDSFLGNFFGISRAIAGQLDFQSVLREIKGEVNQLIPHDHMDVSIIASERRDTHKVFEVGMTTKWSDTAEAPQPIRASPVRELIWGNVPYFITDDAWSDDRFHFDGAFDAPIFDADLHSRLHVPLHVHGVVHGTLNISSHEIGKYSQTDLKTAQQVADLLAPYMFALIRGEQSKKLALAEGAARGREEALRVGALRLTEGMENERKRLGMDLHDETLADLTRISRQIARMNRKNAPTQADLTKLSNEITTCMSELRRIIEDTKPGVMELFGFAQAVEAQLERSVAGLNPAVKTEVKDSASVLLDESAESLRTPLFRIVQEAINNAVKHGPPRRLSVSITTDDEALKISVVDDGSGTQADQIQSHGGMDNMRVRAALISGNLEISGDEPGGGTRVSVSVPLNELAANEETRDTQRIQAGAAQ